ncbi:ATP-grasp domain-containing protein [Herbiconiux sp. KACC 21604]|uniref:ATP-grasp domain-containing protein n=1 Tax=unclassified Herbiconiux TaxID=2618217 RepID=UPI0014913FA2|nr:ATP-grasp domain-containing protein [Herbiconiux sp. SALV-R1]QJU53852.1 ATP-grasp domain-containing protein [Herbiconiux sp. SALV-R1]WPO84864.1 ATP-grasp domain-containing protein [Herbiconiux sp. KACC 21604]
MSGSDVAPWPSGRRVLVTGSRAPVALDLARLFAADGATVFTADSQPALASRSRSVTRAYRVPSARFRPEEYRAAIAGIVARHSVDLVVPTCEEIFWLAGGAVAPNHSGDARGAGGDLEGALFAPDLPTLTRLHDKAAFVSLVTELGLRAPETEVITSGIAWRRRSAGRGSDSPTLIAKPAFSRFGTQVLRIDRGEPLPELRGIHPDAPWLLQERVVGEELCTTAVSVAGRLTAFVAYRPAWRFGTGAAVSFERLDHRTGAAAKAFAAATRLAASLHLTGQFGLDLIATPHGITLLECNPRSTSGIHLFTPTDHLPHAFTPPTPAPPTPAVPSTPAPPTSASAALAPPTSASVAPAPLTSASVAPAPLTSASAAPASGTPVPPTPAVLSTPAPPSSASAAPASATSASATPASAAPASATSASAAPASAIPVSAAPASDSTTSATPASATPATPAFATPAPATTSASATSASAAPASATPATTTSATTAADPAVISGPAAIVAEHGHSGDSTAVVADRYPPSGSASVMGAPHPSASSAGAVAVAGRSGNSAAVAAEPHPSAPAADTWGGDTTAGGRLFTASREAARLGLPHVMAAGSIRSRRDAVAFLRQLGAPDALVTRGDGVGTPALLRSLAVQVRTAASERVPLTAASTHDLEWNGPVSRGAERDPRWGARLVEEIAREGGLAALAPNLAGELSTVEVSGETVPVTAPPPASQRGDRATDEPLSYVVAPRTHFIGYAREELHELDSRALRAIAGVVISVLDRLVAPARLDRTVIVGNALVSTNLLPELAETELRALTRRLALEHPDCAIAWRSVHGRRSTNPQVLRRAGYRLIPSRSVLFTPTSTSVWEGPRDTARDRAVFDRSGYREVDAPLDPATGTSSPELRDRIAHLYRLLYVEKYSPLNPRYTAEFVGAAQRAGFLRFVLLQRPDGRVDGVFGYAVAHGYLAAPVFGYDTALPQRLGLYRMLSLLVARRAHAAGVELHNSSGVADFKRHRGAEPELEYTAVSTRHLSWRRRLGWAALELVVRGVAVPLVTRSGL